MGQLKYRSLRGMPDILPETARMMRRVEEAAREVFDVYGFQEIRTPILEATEVFTTGVGENTDIVEKEMYTFADRGGKSVSLRPEGTAPIIRAYVEHGLGNISEVFKIFYSGPMFRGERPQKGRLRQFHQIGAEIIGSQDPYSDAELIMTLERIFSKLCIEGHTVFINSLGCSRDRGDYSKALHSYLEPRRGKLCEDCGRRFQSNVLRVLDCKLPSCKEVVSGSPEIKGFLCGDCADSYERLKQTLSAEGVGFLEKRDLVRGLDYYTGAIFEVAHPALGAQDALAAGGRYDCLSSRMGGPDVSATGYAIGVERLLLAIPGQPKDSGDGSGVFVIPLTDQDKPEAFSTVQRMRSEGILCDMDLTGRSIKAQMRKAGKENREFVVFVSRTPGLGLRFSVKDMKTGEQEDDIISSGLIEKMRKGKRKNDKDS